MSISYRRKKLIILRKLTPYRQARSQEGARGNFPQTAFLLSTNLLDKFLLTSFATNIRRMSQVEYKVTNQKKFLLAPLATLFCTQLSKRWRCP